MAPLNLTLLPENCDWLWRDVMGTIFCGCQQFSLCSSGLSEILAGSITASLCGALQRVGLCDRHWARSVQPLPLRPLAA